MPSHLDPWGLAPGKSYNGSAFWVLPGCVDTGGFPFPGPHTFLMRCLPPPHTHASPTGLVPCLLHRPAAVHTAQAGAHHPVTT